MRARVSGPDPAMPLVERARLVLRDARAAAQLRPHQWPETKQIAAAYGAATGSPRTLSELKRDAGLRAIVELIAAGYAVDDITWLASSVPREPWWPNGDRIRGLGSLSVEVASRALGERDAPSRPSGNRPSRIGWFASKGRPTNWAITRSAESRLFSEAKRSSVLDSVPFRSTNTSEGPLMRPR